MEGTIMKLEYMSEDDVIILNKNSNKVIKEMNPSGPGIDTILGKKDFILMQQDIEYKDVELDTSEYDASDAPKSDLKNIKMLYSSLKSLSDSLATDRRIWTALAFGRFYNYMQYRWPVSENTDSSVDRYLIKSTSKRALMRHGISRLWWFGRLTIDTSLDNPYELTEYLCKKGQDCMENLCDRTSFDNFQIMKGLLLALRDAEKDGMVVDRNCIREVSKYVNILGANYVVDYFSKDDMYSRIYAKLEEMNKGH